VGMAASVASETWGGVEGKTFLHSPFAWRCQGLSRAAAAQQTPLATKLAVADHIEGVPRAYPGPRLGEA
jgi:hypothetical protein